MKANHRKLLAILVLLAMLALACAVGGNNTTKGGDQGQAAQPDTEENPTT